MGNSRQPPQTSPSPSPGGGLALAFASQPTGLRVLPFHLGHSREQSAAYDWSGRQRGRAEFGIFQYTLAGRGLLERGGQRWVIGPGQAMLLRVPDHHRYRWPEGGAPWEFLYLCFRGREALRLWDDILARTGPVLEMPADHPALETLRDLLAEARTGRLADRPHEASARTYRFLMELAETAAPRPDAGEPAWLARALACAREHGAAPGGVAALARAAGLSRAHFSRSFQRATGSSPGAYLRSLRIREAARRLQARESSVKEVAFACGYRHPETFARAFARHLGQNPRDFRRMGTAAGPAEPRAPEGVHQPLDPLNS